MHTTFQDTYHFEITQRKRRKHVLLKKIRNVATQRTWTEVRGLKKPNDVLCQLTFPCYIMFCSFKDFNCRILVAKIFKLVSEHYNLDITHTQCRKLANIFI